MTNSEGSRGGLLPPFARAGLLLGLTILASGWWFRSFARRGSFSAVGTVAELATANRHAAAVVATAVLTVLLAASLRRRPELLEGPPFAGLVVFTILTTAACLALPYGHYGAIAMTASLSALVATCLVPAVGRRVLGASDRAIAIATFVFVFALHAFFSMRRHGAFGSGSWDLGCMVHNFYRASRFLDTVSTVLGGVDFLGDHFMLGIYLYAPIAWIDSSAYMVLAVQAANLACAAPALYGIARHHGAARGLAWVVAIVGALSFGMQSAAYFDAHEITVGFGFIALAVYFLEKEKLGAATALLFVFASFKESLGAYVVALGLLLLWRGMKSRSRRTMSFGAGWIAFGAVWFVVVNRVLMPALIAQGRPPEPHETFGDFGPTVFEAMLGIIAHPAQAAGALFVPTEKLASLLVTFGGFGWLSFLAPEIGLAALPLVAERFLSSKSTMWEMGYHYAAPLCFFGAWAVAIRAGRCAELLDVALTSVSGELRGMGSRFLWVYLAMSMVLVNAFGYRHPSNYGRLEERYFSEEPRRSHHREAVELLRSLGRETRIAAQNRILPHLADRPFIYRLGDWSQADHVLLSVGENAWPWDDGFPGRLARQLGRDPAWRLVFSKGGTAVFARVERSGLPAVDPAPELGLGR